MKKIRLYILLLGALLMVLLTAGVSYAWLARQEASMDTLLEIVPPDTIIIIPVTDGGEPMTELDLDYREDSEDYKDDEGSIHILRPVCVKSTNPAHRLEVVRTTNLENLSFNIYPAPWNDETGSFVLPEVNSREKLSGTYLNQKGDTEPKLAAQENTLNNNYEKSDQVEAHAYPLYWLATKICKNNAETNDEYQGVTSKVCEEDDPHTGEKKDFYYTYYYLEISWKEETKQTDLFYILAQNVA